MPEVNDHRARVRHQHGCAYARVRLRGVSLTDPRDNRLRPSIMVQYHGRTVLIDTTPDFRQQALRERIARIDAILFTHSHADHIMGLDDVRPLNLRQKQEIPIYGSAETLATIQTLVPVYLREVRTPSRAIPKLTVHPLTSEGVELVRLAFHADPLAPRAVVRVWLSVRLGGISDGPQRHSGRIALRNLAASMFCSSTLFATSRIRRTRRCSRLWSTWSSFHRNGRFSRTSATILPHEETESGISLLACGLPTTVFESRSETRAECFGSIRSLAEIGPDSATERRSRSAISTACMPAIDDCSAELSKHRVRTAGCRPCSLSIRIRPGLLRPSVRPSC